MEKKLNIKKEISKYSFGDNPFIDDAIIKGGYRVVRTIKERNAIDCCHRKLGMKVMVIGQDYSYKDYILKGENTCSNDNWFLNEGGSGPVIDTINDSDVTLLNDYGDLDITKDIETQQYLNQVLSSILQTILNNQTVGDKHYTHEQVVASSLWIVNHNLNKYPSVTVVDSANTLLLTPYEYINNNTVHIEFNGPFAGKAYIN